MTTDLRPLPPLTADQAIASRPDAHVWLAASAGTGKTQVLAARVFRLLLRGVDPGAILCLTFTKAGATEMGERISRRLAGWVRARDAVLAQDLIALGEDPTPTRIARARTLFARVLDAPGGGLRIQTIHSFCQGLLAAFPVEAGLVPGFRPIEPREEALLMRQALSDLLVDADRDGRDTPVTTIGALSVRMGEEGAERFLRDCARAGPALDALPAGVQPYLRRELGLPSGDIEEAIAAGCADLDCTAIERIGAANRAWATPTGLGHADRVSAWLAADPAARVALLPDVLAIVRTGTGTARKASAKLVAADPDYVDLAAAVGDACAELLSLRARAAYADLLAAALDVGRDYARGYAAAKRRAGAVDFDDLIRATVDLLDTPGIGEWVRYKLDQITEHVLIDEAQDTNAHQWRIVRALVDEYFVGRGVHAPSVRTLFTVGDYKQAIFGFQGTDPDFFAAAERYFAQKAADVTGDDRMPAHERGLPFEKLSLVTSFRSTAPVLEFVDAAITAAGDGALGAVGDIRRHATRVPGPGFVELWPPVCAGATDADDDDSDGEEGWIDDAVRANAVRIARQVRSWLDAGLMLESQGRALRPEDVMILVRSRGELAQLLVARLYAEGVPVAGVDRLRLNAPLSVQDLLAAIRFVLQPDDDLSLASLLVSPLIGWTQDDLLARAVPRTVSLWRHLSAHHRDHLGPLDAMLARADFTTPYQFLEALLHDGRRRLLERLGEEARDPIEELLNAALDFETTATPSLQRFLDWFDRGEVEIKRDSAAPADAVRVMTVHGAKGLQAPLVILADATADPDAAPRATLMWTPGGADAPIPVFRPRIAERAGAIDQALALAAARERAEHWRLFYVAATRAEERLVIAGSLSAKWQGNPPPFSWYAASHAAFALIEAPESDTVRTYTGWAATAPVKPRGTAPQPAAGAVALPGWARLPAPVEARPPRPLAPSSLGEDAVADAPPTPAMRAAAERGRRMHALFERLPAVAADARHAAADRWLQQVERVASADERAAIVSAVLRVLDDPAFAEIFGPQALAEAPVSAVLDDGLVVAGTVDRLLVTADRVAIVDFKTGRQVPASIDAVPSYHLRQMAAYAAALARIFPGRAVEAALLYTTGPKLFSIPPEILGPYKPDYTSKEQSLRPDG